MNTVRTSPARREPAKAPTAAVAPLPSTETGIDNLLLLLQRELAEPLKKMADLAGRLEEMRAAGFMPATVSGQQTFAELTDLARHGAEVSERLLSLGEVLSGPQLLADERVLLAESLRQTAVGMTESAHSRGVGFRLDDGRENLAPVYGSGHWLGIALRALLGLVADAAPAGTHVQLRLRQVGFHQLLTAAVSYNAPVASSIDLLKGGQPTVKSMLGAATRIDMLDLVLARAIIELHGGTLKTDVTERGALAQFHLTLPTGEPQALRLRSDCAQCPFMLQAEQFAHDIGELLNGRQGGMQTSNTGSDS
jgi:hypothetical protein